MPIPRISSETPKPGQSLMSFVSNAATDSALGWATFQRVILRTQMRNARLGERRALDWESAGVALGVEQTELFAMSERSELTTMEDVRPVHWTLLSQRPWLLEPGYGAFDPTILKKNFYWLKAWLRPDALVNAETGTLLLRHCHRCLVELAEQKWQYVFPICPACDEPLNDAPVVDAPAGLQQFASEFSRLVQTVYAARPHVIAADEPTDELAGVWLAARSLRSPQFAALFNDVVRQAELGSVSRSESRSAERLAIRHIQSLAAARYLWTTQEAVFGRFKVLRKYTRSWTRTDEALERGLHQLCIEREIAVS